MPAFTFEKISPEKTTPQVRRGALPAVENKPRSVISQVLDRFVEMRVRRTLRRDKGIITRREQRPPD
jgi:hypothetical protein